MSWKTPLGLILLIVGLSIFSVSFVFAFSILPVGTVYTVRVVDSENGGGISGAEVHLAINPRPHPDYPPPAWTVDYVMEATTDGMGLATFDFGKKNVASIIFAVVAEGYTSDYATYSVSYYNAIEFDPSDLGFVVELEQGEIPVPPPSGGGDLTVEVTSESSGLGIADASVYIFEEDVQVDMKTTNSSGVAVFEDLNGFYRVGVDAEGYTSDYAKDSFSYYGAAGVRRDIVYPIVLSPVTVESEVAKMGSFLWLIVGAVVSLVGCGFVGYDKWLD